VVEVIWRFQTHTCARVIFPGSFTFWEGSCFAKIPDLARFTSTLQCLD